MGLNIVKNIIAEINGEISVDSVLDQGTSVAIKLKRYYLQENDRVETTGNKIKKPAVPAHSAGLKPRQFQKDRPNVLIIEDNADMVTYLQQDLSDTYNVYYASNGKEALEKIETIPEPGVILSDIMMDKMDGLEFLQTLPDAYKDIPFIFLTAKTNTADKLEGLKLGALDYIYKPFEMEELKAKIKKHIKQTSHLKNRLLNKMQKYIDEQQPEKDNSLSGFCNRYKITLSEKNIILRVQKGLQNKEIAYALHITEGTVKGHMYTIFKKLEVSNRVELLNKIKDLDLSR